MTDIVERLRASCEDGIDPDAVYEAADTIEALRARVATLEGNLNVARLQLGARVCSECPAKARVAELEAQLRRVIGWHNAPGDCYSTGPFHGDARDDSCPSCEALRMLGDAGNKTAASNEGPR